MIASGDDGEQRFLLEVDAIQMQQAGVRMKRRNALDCTSWPAVFGPCRALRPTHPQRRHPPHPSTTAPPSRCDTPGGAPARSTPRD